MNIKATITYLSNSLQYPLMLDNSVIKVIGIWMHRYLSLFTIWWNEYF